jgi:hypothetical protein
MLSRMAACFPVYINENRIRKMAKVKVLLKRYCLPDLALLEFTPFWDRFLAVKIIA